jgi:hypothetical protein
MINDQPQQALYQAVFKLIRPLVRILLRNGIPYAAFADLAKRAYVDVADKDFGVAGRKQTNSRIATITGLSRKEVQRLKIIEDNENSTLTERYNRAARVVFGWVHDKKYSDSNGGTASLAFDGVGITFSSLVKDYSGDVPPRAILDELLQVGVVQRQEDGQIRLLSRAYIPTKSETAKLRILGTDVYGLISTIDNNIHSLRDKPFFQRKVFYDNLPAEAAEELQELIADRGQKFLEFLDEWISAHDRDVNPSMQGTGRKAAGIGVYYFEDEEFEEK